MLYVSRFCRHYLSVFVWLTLSLGASACSPKIIGISNLVSGGSSDNSGGTFSLLNSFAGQIYFDGGAGTSDSPYLICNREQFLAIQKLSSTLGKYFEQTCDFSMGGVSTPYVPMLGFSGNYNGGNHTISDVHIDTPDNTFIGLFGELGNAVVYNLKIDQIKIQSYARNAISAQATGVLAGQAKYSTIRDVAVTNANISCIATCGGIVGILGNSSLLESSYFDGNIAGIGFDPTFSFYGVGGLVGYALTGADIQYSFSNGTISGSSLIGGLVGATDVDPTITIQENATAMHISITPENGLGYVGGLVGYDAGVTIINNYTVGSLVNNAQSALAGVGGLFGLETVAQNNNYAAMLGMKDYQGGGTFNANGSTGTSYFYNHLEIGATNDAGARNYSEMTTPDDVGVNFVGFDFLTKWTLPDAGLAYPFPQLRSFEFSNLHTFVTSTFSPLQIIEAPDAGSGQTFANLTNASGFTDATLVLDNSTGSSITINSIEMNVGTQFTFRQAASTCTPALVVPNAGSCTLTVRINPELINAYQVADALLIRYTDASAVNRIISHQVDATITLQDAHIVNDQQIFAVTKVGNSTSSTITVTNIGTDPVTNINSFVSNNPDFTIDVGASTCAIGGGLLGGSSCNLVITYSPSSGGWTSGTITIDYDTAVPYNKQATVYVTGLGSTTVDGSVTDPFEVWNDQHLAGMDITGEYHQMAAIDLSAYDCGSFAMGSAFNGTYDGLNQNIVGLCGTALFGTPADGATIKNLNISDFTITSSSLYAGALIEQLTDGTIQDIQASNITIDEQAVYTGGLIGYANQTDILDSSVAGTSIIVGKVSPGSNAEVGGLVGYIINGSITDSYAIANVSSAAGSSTTNVGGLAGLWVVNSGNYSIEDSYFSGDVVSNGGAAGLAGGLVGQLKNSIVSVGSATVSRSFSTGSVDAAFMASGLISIGSFNGAHTATIEDSFSSADVSSDLSAIGLVGALVIPTLSINNCFTSGIISSDSASGANGFSNVAHTGSDNYVSVPSVTDPGSPAGDGIAIWDQGGNDHYYYESGVNYAGGVTVGTALNAAQMEDSLSFTAFSFPGNWRMPVSNPYSPVNSPVPAWLCGNHGVSCY